MTDARRRMTAMLLAVAGLGCASTGLVVDFEGTAAPDQGTLVVLQPVRDVRTFSSHGSLGPVQSTAGDPNDKAWTDRVVGRKLTPTRTLGPDRFLESSETVAGLVERALAGGLQRGGYRTAATASSDSTPIATSRPSVRANLQHFWIRHRWNSPRGTLHYQAEVWVQADLPGIADGWVLSVQGIVSAGAVDGVLWRRAVRTALERVEEALARRLELGRQRADLARRRAAPG
jgi:hypothetical protein